MPFTSTPTWAYCMLSWHCKCGKANHVWDLFRAHISPHVGALHSPTWGHQTHHSYRVASLSFPMISPLAQLVSNKMMEIATQRRRDCGVKWWRLQSKVVEMVASFSSNLKAFTPIYNEQPKPNPSSVACGWLESKWLQGRFIHLVRGQGRALCSLFKTLMSQNKGPFIATFTCFSLCRHRKLDFV